MYLCSSYLVCSKDSSQMRPQASSNSLSRVSVRQTGLWICGVQGLGLTVGIQGLGIKCSGLSKGILSLWLGASRTYKYLKVLDIF